MGWLSDIKYIARLATREDRSNRDHAREHLGHYLNELLAGTPFEGKLAFDQPRHIDLGRGFFIRPVEGSALIVETEADMTTLNSIAQQLTARAESLTESMTVWGSNLIFGSKKASIILDPSHIHPSALASWKHHTDDSSHITIASSSGLLESIRHSATQIIGEVSR